MSNNINNGLAPKPTYLAERHMEGQRLAYYLDSADANYWDNHWRSYLSPQIYNDPENGYLDEYEGVFTRYLPKNGLIIEAGCGMGQYVLALQSRGYSIEGVDWSEETVAAVKSIRVDLPIRAGDVTKLDVPDSFYAGYISLGVMEHRHEGPEPFLREAHRVLAPEGIALISVPYINPLREIKASMGLYRGNPYGLEFYQYAYRYSEFKSILEQFGFRVMGVKRLSVRKGVKDEVKFVRDGLERRNWFGNKLEQILRSSFLNQFGHMIMLVARRS